MSAATRIRIRRWLIVLASAIGLLGWAVAAAAAAAPAAPPAPPAPAAPPEPASKPDSAGGPVSPPKWETPEQLFDAAKQVNDLLVHYQNGRAVFEWDKADLVRRMLLNNRDLLGKLSEDGQGCYQQAMYLSGLAAGYPGDALAAAREMVKLADKLKLKKSDLMQAWVSVSWAAMLCGDQAGCLEVVQQLDKLTDAAGGLDAMKREVEAIGTNPACEMKLSDRTTINPGKCPGKVLMVDFWMYTNAATQDAAPMVRKVRELFRGYPEFRVIGVNMDSHDGQPAATKFAQVQGFDWPSFYEGRTDRAISNKVFMVHYLPTEIVVGPDGKIIYAGKPNNPILVYAIRAALVKANKGEIPIAKTQPDTAAGTPEPPAAAPGPADKPVAEPPAGKVAPTPPATPPADASKADDEKAAAQQMKVALAFIAADAKPQAITTLKHIVATWPDTKAAFQAKSKLLELEY